MKYLSMILFISFLLSLSAQAGDLEVKETLFAAASTSAEVSDLFDQRCAAWKAELKAQLGTKAL